VIKKLKVIIMKQSMIYCVKIWLTTSVLAPLLNNIHGCYNLISNNLSPFHNQQILNLVLFRLLKMIAGDLIFLIPVMAILYYIIQKFVERDVTINKFKLRLAIIATVIIMIQDALIAYCFLNPSEGKDYNRLMLIDSCFNCAITVLVIITSIWLYNFKTVRDSYLIVQE